MELDSEQTFGKKEESKTYDTPSTQFESPMTGQESPDKKFELKFD